MLENASSDSEYSDAFDSDDYSPVENSSVGDFSGNGDNPEVSILNLLLPYSMKNEVTIITLWRMKGKTITLRSLL